MKKTIAFIMAVLMLGLTLAGCSGDGSGGKAKDTVTVLGTVSTDSFNPFSSSIMEDWVKFALFDRLIRFDENGGYQPMLAESWTEESDGLTITLNLRRGMKSHDGEEINADDVIFSIDTMFSVPNYYYLATYMASWEKVDDYTVKIVKGGAYCETLNLLVTSIPVVSKEAYERLGAEGFGAAPVGTGPYTFSEKGADGTVTLKAYAEYWDGKPAFETLKVKAPIDISTAVVALQNGEIDIMIGVPSAQWNTVKAEDKLVLDTTVGWGAMTLGFMNGMKDDVNLRKAIYHGINRQSAITVATEGTAVEARDIYSARTMKELTGTFDVPGYDAELAKDYLAKSNYVAGTPLRITVSGADQVAVAQSIQNDMNQIGINIQIEQVDMNAFSSMLQNGELDLFLSQMGLATVATIDMLFYWESDNPLWGPQIAHDAEYDELCRKMRVETDHEKLMELAHRAMEIQYGLANHLGIYETVNSVAYSKDISGIYAIDAAAFAYNPGLLKPAN